jgi:dTDP-4-amino-4,6-dideoxygalactose transaminase
VLCAERDKLADFLCEKSIGTLVHYPIPLHQQSALSGCFVGNFPVTEMICSSELSLPISNVMGEDEIAYVIESINNFRI